MTTGNASDDPRPHEPTLFAARLTPHRSLSRTGFVLVMAVLSVISFAAGTVFLLMGAWPVFGFFGLDVLLVYWAFRANYRAGQVSEWSLNPLWAKLDYEIDEEFGLQRLYLVSRGRKLPIASFLPPQEKESFATALSAAIWEAKRGPTRTVFE
jgi:uncharacterized membrane protein